MQLKIERKEVSEGIFKKKKRYIVESRLLCSEEERRAISELQLEDAGFFEEYEWRGIPYHYSVKYWADKGCGCPALHPAHAQELEEQIKNAAHDLKERVDEFINSGGTHERSETIDL